MISPPDLQTIDRIVDHLGRTRSILFVTGAGMSADSGLPTYRGVGGLYECDETEEGLPIEEMLSGAMFRQRPGWTWKYPREIEHACRGATFNRGHAVIAEMERHFPRVWTLTQNVDGFHRAAGSQNVIAIYGDLHALHCTKCPRRETVGDYQHLSAVPLLRRVFGNDAPRRGAVRGDAPVGRDRRVEVPVARGVRHRVLGRHFERVPVHFLPG